MKRFLKVMTVILPTALISMFATGCDTGTNNDGTKDTVFIGGDGSGRQELFIVWVDGEDFQDDGSYVMGLENNLLIPIPKLVINGKDANNFNSVNKVYAGKVTYSIIWNDDTLTRTINLPDNIYKLARDTTAIGYNYYVTGGDGDELVEWATSPTGWIVFQEILPISKKFFAAKDLEYNVWCNIRPSGFKQMKPGYSATAESKHKKFAVYEDIELMWFNSGNESGNF